MGYWLYQTVCKPMGTNCAPYGGLCLIDRGSLSQFGWSIRNIDLTEDQTYVPIFIKLFQPFYSIWDCLLDVNYGAHYFTSDVLVVRVVWSVLVFCAQCLAMLFFTFLLFYIHLIYLIGWWYLLNSFYIQINSLSAHILIQNV